ncbi:MAG: hypothetical protein C5B51_23110 [Terriglobia bacterium]|nr:MAG: hypothetical protein C5B51_23110 [Terriglobia bacterium]
MNKVPRWRIAAAIAILASLAFFAAMFAPIYFHNLELQNFVSDLASRPDTPTKSDDLLRTWVLDKAHGLDLPVRADNVRIARSREGMRIEVRYFVRVNLPVYTVDLHFYPGAGSH